MMIRTRALDHTQLTYVLAALRRARGQKTYVEYERYIYSLDPHEVWVEAEKEGLDTESCHGADDVAGDLLYEYANWNPFSRWGACWELLVEFKIGLVPAQSGDGWVAHLRDTHILHQHATWAVVICILVDKFGEEFEATR